MAQPKSRKILAAKLCWRTFRMRPAKAPTAMLTHEDIQHMCGELPDWKVARILASEATYEDLKTAMTWAGGQDDVIAQAEHPLAGRAAFLYEIITADEDIWGENHRT
jgi:hypothetical protein